MKMIERTLIRDGRDLTISSSNKTKDFLNQIVINILVNLYKDPFRQSHLIKDFNELYSKIYDKEKFINS
jgi:hypothetical protein